MTNPNAIDMVASNTVFTNCALTDDGDIWWEGLTGEPPAHAIDWRGNDWTPGSETPAAHPNARFTTPASQCPSIAAEWEDPAGVPIDAILFGGRRASVVPLVHEARDWEHGVVHGVDHVLGDDRRGRRPVGQLRWDPMAMLPFCGYHMADYWGHWLHSGQTEGAKLPKVFYVNWFRKDEDGKFMWPGYGENSRVLAWIFRRCEGHADAVETLIGLVPPLGEGGIDTSGLDLSAETMAELLEVDVEGWMRAAAADARALRAVRRQIAGRAAPATCRSGGASARLRGVTGPLRRAASAAATIAMLMLVAIPASASALCYRVDSSAHAVCLPSGKKPKEMVLDIQASGSFSFTHTDSGVQPNAECANATDTGPFSDSSSLQLKFRPSGRTSRSRSGLCIQER